MNAMQALRGLKSARHIARPDAWDADRTDPV